MSAKITKENLSKHRAKLSVELMNPDTVKAYLKDVGEFASVCMDTDTEEVSPEAIAKHCIDSGHWSPGRATYFIFKVKGISRACSHQMVRHSIGVQINQRSQRYCDESLPVIVIPDSIAANPDALEEYLACVNQCYHTYGRLKSVYGIPGDDARFLLLNATATEMHIAFTPQALIHFCNERRCRRASWEIRAAANWMAKLVRDIEPFIGSKMVSKCVALGYCPEKKGCGFMPSRKVVLDVFQAHLDEEERKLTRAMEKRPLKPWSDKEI